MYKLKVFRETAAYCVGTGPTQYTCEKKTQENPAVARENALQLIQCLLQYWPSRSFKVDYLYVWKPICDFLLVI